MQSACDNKQVSIVSNKIHFPVVCLLVHAWLVVLRQVSQIIMTHMPQSLNIRLAEEMRVVQTLGNSCGASAPRQTLQPVLLHIQYFGPKACKQAQVTHCVIM